VQLGSCLALLLVPLLLLATPQRATLHGMGHHTGAPFGRGEALARLSATWTNPVGFVTSGTPAATPAIGAPSLIHAVNVSFRQELAATTTTTAPPAAVASAPAVRAVTAVQPASGRPAPAAVVSMSKPAAPPLPPPPPPPPTSTGLASWYGSPAGTCASPTLAFGTVVTVTDVSSGQAVRCTVDDREAHNPGRVIDLSPATFSLLASLPVGVIEVRLTW
jgi:Lytic transglycolase